MLIASLLPQPGTATPLLANQSQPSSFTLTSSQHKTDGVTQEYTQTTRLNNTPAEAVEPDSPTLQAESVAFVTRYAFGPVEDKTGAVAHGDFNGDGYYDIVVGNHADNTGLVYLNDGNGSFYNGPVDCNNLPDSVRCFGVQDDNIWSLAVADVDENGSLDIIAGSYEQQSMVFLNDGAANFHTGMVTCGQTAMVRCFGSVSTKTYGVASGDMNGDGHFDIVTANNGRENVVYLNDGAGNFTNGSASCVDTAQTRCFGTGIDPSWSVALGDVDGSNGLDIVIGNYERQNIIYLNKGSGSFHSGALTCGETPDVRCLGNVQDTTSNILAGDLNGDNQLDIVVSNRGTYDNSKGYYLGEANAIYLNNGSGEFINTGTYTRTFGTGNDVSLFAALGDMDSDGDLDIVTGNGTRERNTLYLNDGTGTFAHETFFGATTVQAFGIALADLDNDSDADVIVGNSGSQNAIYLNNGAGQFASDYAFGGEAASRSIATGDMNGDGAVDIIVGNTHGQNMLYLNNGNGGFSTNDALARPFGPASSITQDVVVGDMDADKDLDIVVANTNNQNVVYLNDGNGTFHSGSFVCNVTASTRCFGTSTDSTASIALADIEGDGDLDIVTGNTSNEQNVLYLNDGTAQFHAGRISCDENPDNFRCFGSGQDNTHEVATVDIDRDGDYDIIVGNNYQQNAVYMNDGSGNFTTSTPFGSGLDATIALAPGDVDGDGAIDIVLGNDLEQNVVYRNSGSGTFYHGPVVCGANPQFHCFGTGLDIPQDMILLDEDGDGDLDIVAGNQQDQSIIYLNDGLGNYTFRRTFGTETDTTAGIVGVDIDKDGDMDLVTGKMQQNAIYRNGRVVANIPTPPTVVFEQIASLPANGLPSPQIISDLVIPIQFRLHGKAGQSVRFVRAYYSLDGGGKWLPANLPDGTNVLTEPQINTQITYQWDTFKSGFFGQSDNVVFRIEAYPGYSPATNAVARIYQQPYMAAQTLPFRAQGTLVQVFMDNEKVQGALVYHQPASDSNASLIRSGGLREQNTTPFVTNAQGYLEGRGEIQIGDRLIAMLPITATSSYTLYFTSAKPTSTRLNSYVIQEPGVQELVVSEDNPLMLLHLDISLEWDSRNDERFLARLDYDLQRASEILYDWTNGQVALGELRIFQDKDLWDFAHVRVYATNRLRPNAEQGGIVEEDTLDPDRDLSSTTPITYSTGQVRMGAIWNRYGEAEGNLGEDWPRTLAHELGHFAFFLDDNYIGLDENGLLIPVYSCPGAMSDPYRDDYSEFHPQPNWTQQCEATLSNRNTGRSDWETISTFYPHLHQPSASFSQVMAGPNGLSLEVTGIENFAPLMPTNIVDVPIFYLTTEGGTSAVQPGDKARSFLFKKTDPDGDFDRIVDLGSPTLDQIDARGAAVGDRLCMYEPLDGEKQRVGCEIAIAADDNQVELDTVQWLPDIIVSPVTSRTISLKVQQAGRGLSLKARIFPEDALAPPAITLTESGGEYNGTFTLEEPAIQGYIQVWVDGDEKSLYPHEIVTNYAMGGNPGNRRARGGNRRARGGNRRARGGNRKARGAPTVSSDGQAILYGDGLNFAEGEFYTLQAATKVQNVPEWTTLIGQAYRISATPNAPALEETSFSIGYLGSDVPDGEENWLRMYYWEGTGWRKLQTRLDTYQNMAAAPTQGPGLYALMSSIEIPLKGTGWNLFSYPIESSRTVTEALKSIENEYTLVYGYDATDPANPWRLHARTVFEPYNTLVNSLDRLEFGQGYWIYTTRPITMSLKGGTDEQQPGSNLAQETAPTPPATYFGFVEPAAGFDPVPGMPVTAMVDGVVCAHATLEPVGNTLGFVVHVPAAQSGSQEPGVGCGTPGRVVTFAVSTYTLPVQATWDNSKLHNLSGYPLYLPNLLK
jgi:hypothetical protein